MDAEKLSQVLAAFELLAEEAGGSLDDKPNVSEVKAQGVDVTREERDEAWQAYTDAAAPSLAVVSASDVPVVKNNHDSPLSIAGVVIPPGQSREVPKFDSKHGVLSRWLASGVIEAN